MRREKNLTKVENLLSRIRELTDRFVEPIATVFARTGLTPNAFTLIGLMIGAVAAILFGLGIQLWAGVVLLLCGFFDLIDGAVARRGGGETLFGGVLDSVSDRYVDVLIFTGIILGGLSGLEWGVLALAGCLMVSYVRARAEAAGSGKLDVGVAERAERILILAIGALIGYTGFAVALIAIITHLTVVQRLLAAKFRLS